MADIKFPLVDEAYQQLAFTSLEDVKGTVDRLLDEAGLLRYIDADGRTLRLTLEINLEGDVES